jgi:2-polyprenyl-3-methyl-5-hydroxy-6-metoxy-1,4-benzoquinol methylase
LETKDLPFLNEYFDVIIAGDVLEHLIDPWNLLQKLSKVLRPEGCLLTSIPNFRDIIALNSIFFRGNFNYSTQGIFDKTHLRFFCKKDMIKLIQSVEKLRIEKIIPIQNLDNKNPKRKLFNKLTLNIFEQFVTPQYLFKIIKTN